MKAYEKVAVDFAQALVRNSWEKARGFLVPALQAQWPAQRLAETFKSMYEGYAAGPARSVHFDPRFSMEAWPAKQSGDIGWVYVSIQGDEFIEAVTVVVASSQGVPTIRNIEWGRP